MKKLVIAMLAFGFKGLFAQDLNLVNDRYYQDNKLYTGPYSEYSRGGKLLFSAFIKDGLLNGKVVYFYETGERRELGSYKDGLKDGLWERFDVNGNKTGEGFYVEGKKHGKWVVWDPNGIKRFEMFYANGEKVDTWYEYDSAGQLIAERTFNYASK